MENLFKIYYTIAIFICVYAVYNAVTIEPTYVSNCCKSKYRVIEDRKNNIKHWCMDCKKWCNIEKDNGKRKFRVKKLD